MFFFVCVYDPHATSECIQNVLVRLYNLYYSIYDLCMQKIKAS